MSLPAETLACARWLAWQAAHHGRLDLAQTLIDGVVAAAPHERWSATLQTEVALRRGDAARAYEAATHWKEIAPRDGAAHRAVARACFLAGQRETGREWLRSAGSLGDPIARRWLTPEGSS